MWISEIWPLEISRLGRRYFLVYPYVLQYCTWNFSLSSLSDKYHSHRPSTWTYAGATWHVHLATAECSYILFRSLGDDHVQFEGTDYEGFGYGTTLICSLTPCSYLADVSEQSWRPLIINKLGSCLQLASPPQFRTTAPPFFLLALRLSFFFFLLVRNPDVTIPLLQRSRARFRSDLGPFHSEKGLAHYYF